jgi:hypothetical protein
MTEEVDVPLSEFTGRVVGLCGFLSLSTAVFIAHFSPTRGYELSLYTGTPMTVWIFLFSSFVMAVVLSFFGPSPVRRLGPLLGALVTIVVASLPVIRGYVLFGQFDLLNHAGTVLEVLKSGGFLSPIMYPAMHIEAATLSLIAGVSGYHALSSLTGVFVGLFVLGGTLLVRGFDTSWWTRATGVFMLCLLLPIISIRLPKVQAIPSVFALFYFVFLLGLLTYLFQSSSSSSTARRVTYLLIGPVIVFYHPQFALIALGAGIILIICLQIFGRWFPYEPYLIRRVFGFSALVGVVFWEWVSKLPGFMGALVRVLDATSEGGSDVPDPSGKLEAVGGSTMEIVLKVFGLKILITVVAVGVGLYLLGKCWKASQQYSTPLYLVFASVLMTLPMVGLFFTFLGRVSQGFRYVGLGFGLASIVAAIGIGRLLHQMDSNKTLRIAVAVLLVVSAVIVTPTLFKSPYVFQSNEQVTEAQLTGYDFVFEHHGSGQVTAIHSSPYRNRNALYGKSYAENGIGRESNSEVVYQYGEPSVPASTSVPPHFRNQTFHQNATNVYLVTTTRARERYLDLYNGFRYNESDFVYLRENSDTVYTNGDLEVQYFD